MKNEVIKTIRNLTIFNILIIITFYFVLRGVDVNQMMNTILSSDKKYIIIGIGLMFGYILFESLNLKRTMSKLGEKISIRKALKYGFIGFFFSGITPAASGGQPMQTYFMHKDKVDISKGIIALLVNLIGYQVITISFAIVSFVISYENVASGFKVFFFVGIFLNLIALALLLLGLFSKRVSLFLINITINFLKKIRFKKVEKIENKLNETLQSYQEKSKLIKDNKRIFIGTFFITMLQFICYYSITYCAYRALGLSNVSYFKIIGLQAIVYATTSGIPSPGAVGVSEAAYIGIMGTIIPQLYLNSAMIISRGINFYLYIIISGIVTTLNTIFVSLKNKKDKVVEVED